MNRRILLVAAVLLGTATSLHAQGMVRMVSGRVFDDTTGCPLRGARITAAGSSGAAVSDVKGHYHLVDPPAERFTLMAMLSGYQMRRTDSVLVTDSTSRVDFSLHRLLDSTSVHARYPVKQCELEPADSLTART